MATNRRRSHPSNVSVYLPEGPIYVTRFWTFSLPSSQYSYDTFDDLMADSTENSRFTYIRGLDKKHIKLAKRFLHLFDKLYDFNDGTLQEGSIMVKFCVPSACHNTMFTLYHLGYPVTPPARRTSETLLFSPSRSQHSNFMYRSISRSSSDQSGTASQPVPSPTNV